MPNKAPTQWIDECLDSGNTTCTPRNADFTAFEKHESVALLVCGILLIFLGFGFHPPALSGWLRRLMFAAIGYGVGVLIMMQASIYNDLETSNAWVLVAIPLLCMVFHSIFFFFGSMWIGYFIFQYLAEFILRWVVSDAWVEDPAGRLIVEAIGLIGGLFGYYWLSNDRLTNSKWKLVPIVYAQAVIGADWILYFAACYSKVRVYRVFDLELDQEVRSARYCGRGARDRDEMIVAFAVCFGVGVLAVAWQYGIGLLLGKLVSHFSGKGSDEDEGEEVATIGKERVLRELAKLQKSKRVQNSTWYYVRHKGEYVGFKQHEEVLDQNMIELGLKRLEIASEEPDPSSQFFAAASQLKLLYNMDKTAEEVRREAVSWLHQADNWDLLATLDNDLLNMRNKDRTQYCNEMIKPTTWADFISLQAIVQKYHTEIYVITSLPEPKVVHFPVIPQKERKSILRAQTRTQTVKELKPLGREKERYLLIGSDNGKVLVDKFIAEQSSVLARNIEEAKQSGTNQIRFSGVMTGKVLRSIVEQLEAHYLIKHNDRNPEVQEAYRVLHLVGKFGEEVGAKQADPPVMLMCHYWGYHWGSCDKGTRKLGVSELPEEAPQWQVVSQSPIRTFMLRLLIVLILGLGTWWLLWCVIWGYNYNSFAEGLEFTLFWIAEFLNFALGAVFNMNFWNPIRRRWKSLDKLSPPFDEHLVANVLISHYSEASEDTERTVNGSLRMRLTDKTQLRVWICDDGFWDYAKKPPAPKAPSPPSLFTRYKNWILRLPVEPAKPVTAETAKTPLVDKKAKDSDDEGEPSSPPVRPRIEIRGYTPSFPGEDEMFQDIAHRFGATPKALGLRMIQMCRRVLYRYYSEKNLERVDIGCDIKLREGADILRPDCARGSLRMTFFAKKFGTDERLDGPVIILVGRIKPDYHHYKAGNHNNIFFNELMDGEFIVFLDNDMKPKPDFLMRVLPHFYFYHESSGRYEVNKSVAFLQSPQFFKENTIAGEADFLGGRNNVFFQGIEHGRDGYDLASFAGTNAIFRVPAIRTVDGVPYGSLTEDAHTAIQLHKFGYKSIYAPDRLAVGIAPVTVANSMQQRARWCKGSVQLSFLYFFNIGLKQKDKPRWNTHNNANPLAKETRRDVDYYANFSFEEQSVRNMFRKFYFFDTFSWPFSALTAMFYIVIAFIFLIAAKAPIYFMRDPLLYRSFLLTFLPYFTMKLIFQYLAYHKVNAQDVWVAQEIWFAYGFASVYGIIDAVKELVTGTGLGGWGVTGEGTRSSNQEYFNVVVVFGLLLCMLIRGILYLLNPDRDPVEAASIFFAATIVIQMWPVTSTTVYEWINNAHLTKEDKVDLKRYEIPKYLIFAVFIVFTILIGQLLNVGDAKSS